MAIGLASRYKRYKVWPRFRSLLKILFLLMNQSDSVWWKCHLAMNRFLHSTTGSINRFFLCKYLQGWVMIKLKFELKSSTKVKVLNVCAIVPVTMFLCYGIWKCWFNPNPNSNHNQVKEMYIEHSNINNSWLFIGNAGLLGNALWAMRCAHHNLEQRSLTTQFKI